jgi:CRISPR-associated protein Cas6
MSLLTTLQGLQSATSPAAREAVDLSFELGGDVLPADYPARLEAALLAAMPWAAEDPVLGIHPVRAPLTDAGYMLSRRARLTVRVLAVRAPEVEALGGRTLDLGASPLSIGRATTRPVTPFPTLRAPMVVNLFADEQAFLDDIGMQLEVLDIRGEAMCGRPAQVASGQGMLHGFSLVLHGLSAEHSLRLQTIGLGPGRRLGCGLFVHHKIIDGLDASPE